MPAIIDSETRLRPDPWLSGRIDCDSWRLGSVPQDARPRELVPPGDGPAFAWGRVPMVPLEGRPAGCDAGAALDACLVAGYRPVEVSVTLTCVPAALRCPPLQGALVREVAPGDRDPVVELASRAFTLSRFHQDRDLAGHADAIKAAWADAYFSGDRGRAMSVAVSDGRIVGFLMTVQPDEGTMVVDLVAVDTCARGRGIAAVLTSHARAGHSGIERINVGTQLVNRAAVSAYLRMGFQIEGAAYAMHFHRTREAAA